ncbi:hypothetical protein ACIRJO_01455 [Streptomyces sp. NPDC102394]|uniref:hypothetical protein n=1 Tax=Streptomyces sp. NPDC102394 TaxID=3366167 RepID=UPI003824F983
MREDRAVLADRAAHDLAARRGVVLAMGSRPRTLPGLEPDGRRVVRSDDALFAPGLPASPGSQLIVGWDARASDVARHVHPHPTPPSTPSRPAVNASERPLEAPWVPA